MEGIELLTKIRETTPRMRKIIITGYPTLQNAVDAVNKGADAYLLKPFDVEKVLETIRLQLAKQKEDKEYGQDKVVEFIETRVKELDLEKEISPKKKY
jgi:DNA-binding NtrC family response regulator